MSNRPMHGQENDHLRPIPAMAIAVGEFAAEVARQVRRIYFRGDPRRAAVTTFYQLVPHAETGWALADLDEAEEMASTPSEGTPIEQRRAALRAVLSHGPALKTRVATLLQEQRVHERLVDAGWTDYDVPLNFFVLADANDPWAAGVLLPLAAVLNDVLASASLCEAHWVMVTAVFPDSPPEQDLAVWSFLQALDDFLGPESARRKLLADALVLGCADKPDFAFYLVDSRKEGTFFVRDDQELAALAGNALLALMQPDLARRFFGERNPDAVLERAGYYSSIGAAALVYAPDALQAACAQRIGHLFLTQQLLASAGDGQAALQHHHAMRGTLGDLRGWLGEVTTELHPAVAQVMLDPETAEMRAALIDVTLPELDMENVPATPWVAWLQTYEERLQREIVPEAGKKLAQNLEALTARLTAALQSALDALPTTLSLYPGGLDNATRALEEGVAWLELTTKDAAQLAERVTERQTGVAQKLKAQREQIGELLSHAPELPGLLRLLPATIRQRLAPLYLAWRYGPELALAKTLRDECLTWLSDLCGLHIEQQALNGIKGMMIPGLLDQLRHAQDDIAELRTKAEQALASFSPDWPPFPLEPTANGWHALFRKPVTDRCLADWFYGRYQPDLTTWLPDFLNAPALFADWRAMKLEALVAWVQERGSRAYHPIWHYDLESLFTLGQTDGTGFVPATPLDREIIAMTMAVATPPVRPDYNAIGGFAEATFHGLIGSADWQHCCLPGDASHAQRWQQTMTGDPYTALFIQVCRTFPLRSLVASFSPAWQQWERLSFAERLPYDLLSVVDHVPPPVVKPEDLDGSDDLVTKMFRWKFRPRGSGKETEQEISLSVSQSRYLYWRHQPRLSGQWHRYAEVEMPEVRDLAAAFQALHAQHKWSTFNQALNVLTFVQSCIPYSFDKDTTGQNDWTRYPIETLLDGTGDCEDVAVLCASIIVRLGFQVVLLHYPGHVAFGVAGADHLRGDYILDPKTGLHYFYGEATASGWHLGQIPEKYADRPPEQILPVSLLLEEN